MWNNLELLGHVAFLLRGHRNKLAKTKHPDDEKIKSRIARNEKALKEVNLRMDELRKERDNDSME